MFADHLRSAVEAAPRTKLPELAALLWRAYGEGQLSEIEAEEISGLIDTKKVVPAAPRSTPVRRGSRPRTDASLERRRRWAISGRLPPALAWKFTVAELAVLSLVAAEVAKHGKCTLAHGHLAAVVGVSVSSVKRAMVAARDAGLIEIEVRRVSAFRNQTNIVTVTSREWLSWLRLARRGGGVQVGAGTPTDISRGAKRETGGTVLRARREGAGGTPRFHDEREKRFPGKDVSDDAHRPGCPLKSRQEAVQGVLMKTALGVAITELCPPRTT